MDRGDIGRQVSRLRQLVRSKSFGDAAREAEAFLEAHPENAELLALAADIQRRQKKLDEAEALVDRARAVDPFHASVLAVAADLAYDRGSYRDAAARYRELVDRRPSSYHYSRLVAATHRLGDSETAAALARQGLERFPNDPWILRGLAASAAKLGRHDEAVAVLEELLRIEPGDRFAYKELMRLKTEKSAPEEAASALKGLMRSGSRSKNPHLKTLAADRFRKAGRLEEAAAGYEEALELEPGNAFVLAQLGFTYKKLGREEEAFDALSKAFLAKPENPYVRKSLEALAKNRGELARYLSLLDEALKLHPSVKLLHGVRKRVARLATS